MTIVEKVIALLDNNGEMSLKEIYEALPEHTHACIRGNINRHIASDDAKIKRTGKGLYSNIEVIAVTEASEGGYLVDYSNTYYSGDNEVSVYHKNFYTDEPITPGVYCATDDFSCLDKMENDAASIRAMLQKGDVRDVLKKLKSESFNLLLTDPPYKVISGGSGGKGSPCGMLSKNDGKIFTHNDINFDEWVPECYRVLKPNSHAYIFTNLLNLRALMDACEKAGFKIHNILVWEKNNATPNRWYMKNCEFVLFLYKGKAKSINDCGSKMVEKYDNIIGTKTHETEKPVDLLKRYILNSSEEDDWVLDPFAGSGSTAVAALNCNRKVFTIEIDSKYIPNIKNRLKEAIASA